MDSRNLRADWGPSNFNLPNWFTVNFSYELPVGHGKSYMGAVSGIADNLVSGWQLNGIISAQNGFPFTPLVGSNQSGSGDTRNPDRVSVNPNFSGDRIVGRPEEWYPNAFLLPLAGTYGNAGRDILSGPACWKWTPRCSKTFAFAKRPVSSSEPSSST
jgi:hypothetical protein